MNNGILVAIVAILAYGYALTRFIPERWHLLANSLAATTAVVASLWAGLNFAAIGLSLHFVPRGIFVAAASSIGIMLVAGLITLLLPAKHLKKLRPLTRPGKVAYESAVRIPVSTALSEEILFRGVLLGVLIQQYPTVQSVIACSVVFGLWHIVPSLKDRQGAALVPTIIATAAAGVFFCWLRLASGSIIAPWLVHWTVNASALLAVHFINKKVKHLE